MGFKCPVCIQDFGRDQGAWKQHCDEAHDSLGAGIISALVEIAETQEHIPTHETSAKRGTCEH
jgi:hypothetical protein